MREHAKQLSMIHGENDNKSWITLFRKGKTFLHFHYKYEGLTKEIDSIMKSNNNADVYISMNTFYKPERLLENLRYLNALYIDIDYYKTNYRKESVLYFLKNDLYKKKIPVPSQVIDSGRGLYLIWYIDKAPSMALSLWKAIEYYLYEQLKDLGADRNALDPTRVLRIAGSYNSAAGRTVKILEENNIKYSLRDIKNEYLPEVCKKTNSKKSQTKIKKIFNIHSLYSARIKDLETLCRLRNYNIKGSREVILYLYRYYNTLVTDDDTALLKTYELNSLLNSPLPVRELKRDTQSSFRYNGKYNYKTDTIIELLDITDAEQLHMCTLVNKSVKYERNNIRKKKLRRNKNGLTNRQQLKLDRLYKVAELIRKKTKVKDIALALTLSIRQIQRYIKELKNDVLLYMEICLKNKKSKLKFSDFSTFLNNMELCDIKRLLVLAYYACFSFEGVVDVGYFTG